MAGKTSLIASVGSLAAEGLKAAGGTAMKWISRAGIIGGVGYGALELDQSIRGQDSIKTDFDTNQAAAAGAAQSAGTWAGIKEAFANFLELLAVIFNSPDFALGLRSRLTADQTRVNGDATSLITNTAEDLKEAITNNPGTAAVVATTAVGTAALLKGRTPPVIDGTRGGLIGALFGRTRWGKFLRLGVAVVGTGAVLASRAEGAELPEDASLSEQFVAAANDSGLTEKVIQAIPFADAVRTVIEDGGISETAVDSAIVDGAGLAGGLTGAWAGAAAGATIGSIIPIVGTAIGGAVGGFIGYMAGDTAGTLAAETLTENFNSVATVESTRPEANYATPSATNYYANNFQLGG